ncbi:hypothetical protein DIPPA_28362 [Diplonema papillatum]|nr:hypothetical protein DIPPA_28362 [Diplonema papillatum]
MVPDMKLQAREKKVFDTTAKPKERLKLLASMAEDGFQPAGIADLYRRRGGQIVELYKAQIQYLSSSASARGKQPGVDHLLALLDVLRRLVSANRAEVKSGWQVSWLLDEAERFLFVDNPSQLRRTAFDVLLHVFDAMADAATPMCFELFLSAFDWNTLRQLCNPQPSFTVPPSTHVLRSRRHDFIPVRAAQRRDDVVREALDLFSDLFDFIARPAAATGFWWSVFKHHLCPVLYPACLSPEAAAPGEAAPQPPWRVHKLVVGSCLLPLLSDDDQCGTVLATSGDTALVFKLLQLSFTLLPQDELRTAYQIARLYYQWLTEPTVSLSPPSCSRVPAVFNENPDAAVSSMAKGLVLLFSPENFDPTVPPSGSGGGGGADAPAVLPLLAIPAGGVSAASAVVPAQVALCELVGEFFIAMQQAPPGALMGRVQAAREIRTRGLFLYLGSVVTNVFRGVGERWLFCDAVSEMVSRAFWCQWLLAKPQLDDMRGLCALVNRCTERMVHHSTPPVVQCVPHTVCMQHDTFTSNALVSHWRIVMLSLLRVLISHCSNASLPVPFASLLLSRAPSLPGPAIVPTTDLPPHIKSGSVSPASPTGKCLAVLSLHKQRTPPVLDCSVQALVEDYTPAELASAWVNLLTSTLDGSEAMMPHLVHLSRLHGVADIVADLLFASRSARIVDGRRSAPSALDAPAHLLASATRVVGLGRSALPAELLCRILLPPLLRGAERRTPEFIAAGGARIAVASLCDILSMGTRVSQGHLAPIISCVASALTGRDPALVKTAVYRLFPCSTPGETTQASHLFVTHHTDCLVLLAPLVCAAYALLNAAPHSTGDCDLRETATRCAGASLMCWAVGVCTELATEAIAWPDGWDAEGIVLSSVPECPSNFAGLRKVVMRGFLAGVARRQPVHARVIALKGLAVLGVLLCKEASEGSAASAKELEVVVNSVAYLLLEDDASVALSASCCLVTVIEVCASCALESDSYSGLINKTANHLSTALLHVLSRGDRSLPVHVVVSLIRSIHIVIMQGTITNETLQIVLDTLSYALSSRIGRAYQLTTPAHNPEPDTPSTTTTETLPCTAIPLAHPPPAAAPAAHSPPPLAFGEEKPGSGGGSAAAGRHGSVRVVAPSDPPWWTHLATHDHQNPGTTSPKPADQALPAGAPPSSAGGGPDATPEKAIQTTAELVLEHIVAYFRFFPVPGHGPAMTGSLAAPDLSFPEYEHFNFLCGSKEKGMLLTLSDSGQLHGTLYLTARGLAGKYCWQLRPVGAVEDSIFNTTEHPVGYGQSRSKSGVVMGRSRTRALHEASGAHGDDVENERLSEVTRAYLPSYVRETPEAGESAPHPSDWRHGLRRAMAEIDHLMSPEYSATSTDAQPAPAVPCDLSPEDAGGPHALKGRLARSFLATGPLLDVRGTTHPSTAQCLAHSVRLPGDDSYRVHQAVRDVDEIQQRDAFSIALLYVKKGQTTSAEILSNGPDGCSQDYLAFIEGLGWRVRLDQHQGYTGGVQYDPEAHPDLVYHATATEEIAFHVSTLVGLSDHEAAQEQRRRLLALDQIQVIWTEDGSPYNTGTVVSPNVQHWIVVQKVSTNLARVSLASKSPVLHSPLTDGMCLPISLAPAFIRIFARCALAPHRLRFMSSRRTAIAEAAAAFKRMPPSLSQIVLPLFAKRPQVAS